MFSIDQALRNRKCFVCERVIPKNTYHVAKMFAFGHRLVRRNYCAICALDSTGVCGENKYVKSMIRKATRESITQGYCCEDKKLSKFCNGCHKALDCFTTIKKKEKEVEL